MAAPLKGSNKLPDLLRGMAIRDVDVSKPCSCIQKAVYAISCTEIPQSVFQRFVCPIHTSPAPAAAAAPIAADTSGYIQCILHPDILLTESENVSAMWPVCYHGASLETIYSILRHGEFLMEGDVMLDGNYLTARHTKSKDQKPAIWTYPRREGADGRAVDANFDEGQTIFKILLQMRQKPKSYATSQTLQGFEIWSTNRRGTITIEAVHIKVKKSKAMTMPSPTCSLPGKVYIATFACPIQQSAFTVLEGLNLPKAMFDGQFNRCYCSGCYPDTLPKSIMVGGEKYVIPKGWVRFGLAVNPVHATINDMWDSWFVAFHGCKVDDVESIVKHRSLQIPHDFLSNGKQLAVNCSADVNQKCYFLSPSIGYAAHPWYARPVKRGNRYLQAVLVCKASHSLQTVTQQSVLSHLTAINSEVRPEAFDKQMETEGGSKKMFDDYTEIPEDQIEWYSSRRGCVHIYGLLLRTLTDKELEKVVTYYDLEIGTFQKIRV